MYEKPLSYSGLSLYEKCPRAWADVYINGNRSEPGPAAQRGTALHKALEEFFRGGEWPEDNKVLSPWKEHMHELKLYNPLPEEQMAVWYDWEPTSFDDPTASFRGAVDLSFVMGNTLYIKDWKSGKQYDSHKGQADMYACLGQSVYAPVDYVEVEMVYLDDPHTTSKWKYNLDEIIVLMDTFDGRADRLRNDESHQPHPDYDSCKWCPLSWRRGGSCHAAP